MSHAARSILAPLSSLPLFVSLLAGCGNVAFDPSASGGDGTGAGSQGGAGADAGDGGSGAATGGSSSGGASSGGASSGGEGGSGAGGQPGDACFDSSECPDEHFCALPQGQCSGRGTCEAFPRGCLADCPGVCGCDGAFYCNACNAAELGVNTSSDPSCLEDVEVRAYLWLGGLDHMILMRANHAEDTCIRVYADWPTAPGGYPQVGMPNEWAVNSVTASTGAAGCLDENMMPASPFDATGASGMVDWRVPSGVFYPCAIDVDLTLDFSGTNWPNPIETFVALGLPLDGGCQ